MSTENSWSWVRCSKMCERPMFGDPISERRTWESDVDREELVLGEVLQDVREAHLAQQARDVAMQRADAHVAGGYHPHAVCAL